MIRSVGTVGGMTLTSRVTGLIRDIAFAQFLGSGPIADAFFVAFRIPNFFRRIFGEGALSAAFVPVYSEYESRYPEREVKAFLSLMAGRLGLILILFTFFGVLFAPQLIHLIAPGFAAEPLKFDAAVTTLRLAFPYLFFISLGFSGRYSQYPQSLCSRCRYPRAFEFVPYRHSVAVGAHKRKPRNGARWRRATGRVHSVWLPAAVSQAPWAPPATNSSRQILRGGVG